jgi:hypothetical protein
MSRNIIFVYTLQFPILPSKSLNSCCEASLCSIFLSTVIPSILLAGQEISYLYETRSFINVLTRTHDKSILRHMNPVHTVTRCFPKIINILHHGLWFWLKVNRHCTENQEFLFSFIWTFRENSNEVVFFDNMKTVNWRRCRGLSQTQTSTCLKHVTFRIDVACLFTVSEKVMTQNNYRMYRKKESC